jgi:hypothetical protein
LVATLHCGRGRPELLPPSASGTLPGAARPGRRAHTCAVLLRRANQDSSLSECSFQYGVAGCSTRSNWPVSCSRVRRAIIAHAGTRAKQPLLRGRVAEWAGLGCEPEPG